MQRPSSSRVRRWGMGALALLMVLLPGLVRSDIPGLGVLHGVQAAAHPHRFNLLLWEAVNLLGMRPRAQLSDGEAALERYAVLARSLRESLDPVESALRRERIGAEMRRLEPDARHELQTRIGEALRAEGLVLQAPLLGRRVFPPVAFTFQDTPRVLIISPRSEIAVLETVHLDPGITLREIEALEESLAQKGLSALVEPLGGLSTYPALVAPTPDTHWAASAIAHEWTHHYLFFRPLGQHYGDNGAMASINETVADMVGQEIAAQAMGRPPPRWRRPSPPPPGPPATVEPEEAPAFSFSPFLRETRLNAERLLSEGQLSEGETYMEARRKELEGHGIFIRKLNQAYFAFHGTYADSPGSVSPIFDQLVTVRLNEPSIGAFLRRVASIQTPEQLAALAEVPSASARGEAGA